MPRCAAIAAGTALRFAVAVMACVIAVGLLGACTVEPVDSPDVSAAPTRTPTPVAAATTPPTATPEPSFKIANTDGDGVAVRDACDDGARVSAPGEGIREETVVVLIAAGEGDCGEWMHVRASDGRASWVRSRYLDALPVERTPTQAQTPASARAATEVSPGGPRLGTLVQVGSLDLLVHAIELYDSAQHNLFNGSNVRVRVTLRNARGRDVYEMTLNQWSLFDQNGLVHDHDILCVECPGDLSDVQLAPGGAVLGYIYFEVPLPNSFGTLRYKPLFSTNEATVTLN